jgi:hypothetical protein
VLFSVWLQVRKKHFHVLLTTYELLMSEADRARLVKIKWEGIVVDEGHRWVGKGDTVRGHVVRTQAGCWDTDGVKVKREGIMVLAEGHRWGQAGRCP